MHVCEESLEKISAKDIELFQHGSVHEFYRLKALITLEQVNTSTVEKKESKMSETVRLLKLSLYANESCMRFIFGGD